MTPASPNGRLTTALTPDAGGLLKASLQAGAGFVVLFAGLTFGPYFWDKSQAASKADPKPAEKAEPKPAEPQPPTAPTPSPADPSAKTGAPVVGKPPGKDDIVSKLGENGTKTAPAKVNPLDKKDDDLLKDIK